MTKIAGELFVERYGEDAVRDMVDSHKVEPRTQGRQRWCVVCGCSVQLVRHGVRRSFWRHTSYSQLANLRAANHRRSADAGNI